MIYLRLFILILFFSKIDSPAESVNIVDQVNILWRDEKYEDIFATANSQISNQEDPAEPLAILFGYYFYVSPDRNKALASLEQLALLFKEKAPAKYSAILSYKKTLFDIPPEGEESSAQRLASLHQVFPNRFPITFLLMIIHGKQ